MKKKPQTCKWTLDAGEQGDSWDTSCGEKFQFTEGGQEENKCVYCSYCGGKLIEARAARRGR